MTLSKGASLLGLRELNARTVLDVIRLRAPISRAQLSRAVGLTRPTVSSAIETLLEAGLVRQAQAEQGGLSYGATFYEPAPDAAYLLSFDIDRRRLRAVLMDASGAEAAVGENKGASTGPDELVARSVALAEELCDTAGVAWTQLATAVAGVPAAVHPADGRLRMSAYRLLDEYDLGPALTEALGLPVLVHNDVNLAALGEHTAGAARGVDDFAYLAVGANVGAGIILRGEILPGRHGAAGEVDSPADGSPFLPDSPAADGFAALARQLLETGAPAGGPPPFQPTPASVFAAARRGDPLARRVLDLEADRIAERASLICRVVDVELVVLGGSIGLRCAPLLDAIRGSLTSRLRFPPRVELSALDDSALAGARAVGVRRALADVTTARLASVLTGS